jgi:hypothetical protein
LVSIPTELERQDARRDIGILLFSVIFGWTAVDTYGVPLVVVVVLLSPVALYCLTGEPAADVGFVGDIAAGLRHRLGQRRAHEWLVAAAHYYTVAVYPVWRRNCLAFWNYSRQQMSLWLQHLNEASRSRLSRGYSWVYRIRPNWSVRRAK